MAYITKVLLKPKPCLVSMIDAGLFDKLEQIARQVRKNTRPFGGIQVSMHPVTF